MLFVINIMTISADLFENYKLSQKLKREKKIQQIAAYEILMEVTNANGTA